MCDASGAEERLQSRPGDESVVRLSIPASELFQEWSKTNEARLRPEGDLRTIADWGNKLPGQLVRLAGNIHALSHYQHPGKSPISERTLNQCLMLVDYFAEHAKAAAFSLMGADPATLTGVRIAEWLRGRSEVTQREIHRARQDLFQNAAEVTKVVDLLVESGYLRRRGDTTPRSGGLTESTLSAQPSDPVTKLTKLRRPLACAR